LQKSGCVCSILIVMHIILFAPDSFSKPHGDKKKKLMS